MSRMIDRLKHEAEDFAESQKVKNSVRKKHRKLMKTPQGTAIGGKELDILRRKHKLDGREWNYPVNTTVTSDEIVYGIGGSRANFIRAIQSKVYKAEHYTEKDLLEKFGKVPNGNPDPDILKEILLMKSRGL